MGESLILECKVEAAIDIDTTVNITWSTGDTKVRRMELPDYLLNNYSDFLTIPVLSRYDHNRVYQVEVITNTIPPVKALGIIELNVICKFKNRIQ